GADDQQAPPAVMIAERAAEQEERREREQIGVHYPLNVRRPRGIARPDRRKRDVHHRPVDEAEAGGEDAADESPARMRAPGSGPSGGVAWAQSTRCAIAASTILRHVP